MKLKTACKLLADPASRWATLPYLGLLRNVPDRKYVEEMIRRKLGYEPDLDHPTTYCEKLNWLKLHDRKPIYTVMADKYKAKQFVSERIGAAHVVPLYGVWEHYGDIDFDKLPDQFVLKCNLDGGKVIVKNKAEINHAALRRTFEKKLRRNYFYFNREWPYKDIPPRIIAEAYIPSLGARDSVEYKLTCCNGVVKMITVCTGIAHDSFDARNNDHVDKDWNRYNFYAYYKPSGKEIKRPAEMDDMIRFAEILSADVPCLRVDFYVADGKIYFGEMTFYTWAGFIEFTPPEWDRKMGDWIQLPDEQNP